MVRGVLPEKIPVVLALLHRALALDESRELSSPPLAAFLPLTCPNTPAWVFKCLEGKLAVYMVLRVERYAPKLI